MKVLINGTEKEVIFSEVYTRKIDREFNNIMFEWMLYSASQLSAWWVQVDLTRMQKANDFLIVSMTNLSQDELDEMDSADYNKVLAEVEKIKLPSWE